MALAGKDWAGWAGCTVCCSARMVLAGNFGGILTVGVTVSSRFGR